MKTTTIRKTHKRRRSPEQWQNIMLAYENSDLTQADFCRKESLVLSTFHKWRQRLSVVQSTPSEKPLFVELTPPTNESPSTSNHWDIELVLSDNLVLRLRPSI